MSWMRIRLGFRPRRSSEPGPTREGEPGAAMRPVLVGVDGSDISVRALDWAIVRATAGRTSLHIVHAGPAPVRGDGWVFPCIVDGSELSAAHRVLVRAAAVARSRAPELPIIVTLRDGNPVAALVDEGRAAQVIVVGSLRDRRNRWALWSVTNRLARRAPGRVVIVSPDNEVLV